MAQYLRDFLAPHGRLFSFRLRLRNFYVSAINNVPLSVLTHLRDLLLGHPRGSLRHKAGTALVRPLRFRSFPDKVFSIPDCRRIRMRNSHSIVTQSLFWKGIEGYEGRELQFWQLICADSRSVLELGANVGIYSVFGALASPLCRYVAVEPNPTTASFLRDNLSLNGISNAEVVERAVIGGSEPPTLRLFIPDADTDLAASGAFLETASEISVVASKFFEVTTVSILDLVPGVDAIKLDVEGLEAEILASIETFLVHSKPTLVLEIREGTPQLVEYAETLRHKVGYRIFGFDADGLRELADESPLPYNPKEFFGNRDIIMTVREPSLWKLESINVNGLCGEAR